MRHLYLALAALLLFVETPQAADLLSSGNWTLTIGPGDLVAGAGSNLQSQFDSVSGVTTLTISNLSGPWQLKARRSDNTWNGAILLRVKRTSDGSGAGTISGGTSYAEITAVDTDFFSGSGDRSNVAVQFRLTGMSVQVSPNIYSTSIIFTLVY